MTRRVPITDVLALVVPAEHRTTHLRQLRLLLDQMAYRSAVAQYAGRTDLIGLDQFRTDALITTDPAQVEQFQPAHDCAACRAGNDQAKAHLREHPDQPVALVNIYYTEVWE